MAKDHDFSLDKWLDGLGLPAAERATVAATLAADEKRVAYIRDSQLAQSDYAFKMNQLRQQEQTLQQKLADEERYVKELDDWKAAQTGTITAAQAAAAKAQGEAVAYAEYLRSIGIDPTTLGLSTTAAATATTTATTEAKTDTTPDGRYVTRDQAIALARWPVLYDQLNRQHQDLFGAPMDGVRLFDEVMKSTDDPQAVFDRLFDAPAKRAEKAEAAVEARIAQARADERVRVQSELMANKFVPQANPITGISPALVQFGAAAGQTNAQTDWLQSAAQDFNQSQAMRGANGGV